MVRKRLSGRYAIITGAGQGIKRAAPPGLKAEITSEEAARAILYLASDDSKPTTGENYILTGESKPQFRYMLEPKDD